MWWWLVAGITVLVDGINWTFTMRLPQRRRTRALPRQSGQSILSFQLLAYTLAHVGGPIGAAFSWLMPKWWPAWMYGVLVLFLAFEVLYLISWFAYQFYSRRSSPLVAAARPPEVDI